MKRLICFALILCLVLPVSVNAVAYSERDQLGAFMEYMNEKAAAIGMVSSKFNDPMGGYNFTTARDFARLLVWVDQYWELMRVFGAEERELSVRGENPRPQTVTSTIRAEPSPSRWVKPSALPSVPGWALLSALPSVSG